MLQLRYGSYAHDFGEVSVVIERSTEYAARGVYKRVETWSIEGRKVGSSASDLTTKLTAMEAAYAFNSRDVLLIDENGGQTVHRIASAATLGGVQVVQPPSYPDGSGAQYATFRDYTIVLRAEFLITTGVIAGVVEYQESVSLSGGGPVRVVLELDEGDPVEQIVRDRTAYQATQSGSLRSLIANPTPPKPLWPDKLQGNPRIVRGTPDETNGVAVVFPLSWSYEFLSATPLK